MQFSNSGQRDVARTFRRPPTGKVRNGSLLVHLRTDLQFLYGLEGSIGGKLATPLLAALGTLAGLELLAKYWHGKADIEQKHVQEFLTGVAGLSSADAEVLIQFRNSLAHGYALATRRRKDQKPFGFSVDTVASDTAPVISAQGEDAYIVNLWSLKRLFLAAIKGCRRDLLKKENWMRLGNFQVCIRNMREVEIRA